MWKIGLLGVAASTLAVGTVVAWPHAAASVKSAPPPAAATSASPVRTNTTAPVLPSHRVASAPADPVDCATVGRHMLDLALLETPMPANMPVDGSDSMGRILRLQFEGVCRDAAWSQATMACVLAADDMWNAMMCNGASALPPLPTPAPASSDASCAAIAAHAYSLMAAELAPNLPDDQRAAFTSQRAQATAIFETQCMQQAWTDAQRRCALAATTPLQLGACTQNATPRVTPVPPGADASCTAVGKHIAAELAQPISEDVLPGIPEEVRKTLSTSAPDTATQVETACTNGNWPDSLRRCLLGTHKPTELAGCQHGEL